MLSSSSGSWSPRVRTTPGEKRSCPGTYARLPPRRPCKYARPAALFDERSDRQVSCGSPELLVPRAKKRGFATVDDFIDEAAPARRVRLQRRPCVDAVLCKTRFEADAGRVPRVSTPRARSRTSLYYLLEDRSLRVPGADPGRVSRATLATRPSLLRGVAPAPRRPQCAALEEVRR